jgi:hypothetical protein
MSDPSEWEKGNGDYIHTALNWLRLSLIRLSQQKESCIENYQEGRIDDGAAIQETAAEERATYDSIPDESAREKSEISPKDHTEGSTVVETTPQSGDVTGPKAEFQSTEQTTEKKKQDGSWGWFKSVLAGNQGDNGKENSQSSPSGVEIKKDESHVAQAPQEPSPKVERQVTSSEVDEAALKMDKVAQDMKQPPALILLGQRLGLSTFEISWFIPGPGYFALEDSFRSLNLSDASRMALCSVSGSGISARTSPDSKISGAISSMSACLSIIPL